jgi:hypothetical protein
MTLNSELALASRVMNSLNDQLPAGHKLDLEAEWGDLVAAVNRSRSEGASLLAIYEWRQRLQEKASARLAHAPLEEVER